MAIYRVHQIRPCGFRQPGERLDADDDMEAVELLRLRMEDNACELWFGARRVAVVPRRGGPPILDNRPAVSFEATVEDVPRCAVLAWE